MRAAYPIPMSWGLLTPMARLEYRHEFDGGFGQGLNYADLAALGTPGYTFSGTGLARDSVSGGLMLRAQTSQQLSADLEYLVTSGGSQFMSQSIRAAVRYGF